MPDRSIEFGLSLELQRSGTQVRRTSTKEESL